MVCAQCVRDSAHDDVLEVCIDKDFTEQHYYAVVTDDVITYQQAVENRAIAEEKVELRKFCFAERKKYI